MVSDPFPWSFSFPRPRCREVTSFFCHVAALAKRSLLAPGPHVDDDGQRPVFDDRRHLSELRADVHAKDDDGQTPLLAGAPSGTLELTQHSDDDDRRTPLAFGRLEVACDGAWRWSTRHGRRWID